MAGYSENHTKPIDTVCGQSAELLIVKAGGIYCYQWILKGWSVISERGSVQAINMQTYGSPWLF
jgi:hypothetical protein